MSNCVLCRSLAQPNPLVIENLEELVGFDKDKFENLQHIPEVRSLSLGKNMESVLCTSITYLSVTWRGI